MRRYFFSWCIWSSQRSRNGVATSVAIRKFAQRRWTSPPAAFTALSSISKLPAGISSLRRSFTTRICAVENAAFTMCVIFSLKNTGLPFTPGTCRGVSADANFLELGQNGQRSKLPTPHVLPHWKSNTVTRNWYPQTINPLFIRALLTARNPKADFSP